MNKITGFAIETLHRLFTEGNKVTSQNDGQTRDNCYGEFEMGAYSFPASEILFNVDNEAYVTELKTYQDAE